jgi:hypothetical protein
MPSRIFALIRLYLTQGLCSEKINTKRHEIHEMDLGL